MSQSVVDSAVRPLVDESIRAFNGGAHRAAIVSVWIAVVVDLTNKIRSLAEAEDAAAKVKVAYLDAAVEAHDVGRFQIFENELIEFAEKTLELIDRQEGVHLSRLKADRNLCAHPGYDGDRELFSPSPEAVRAHLVAAYDAVFSKHAVAGKRRQKRLQDEIQGESWPDLSVLPDYLDARFFGGAPTTTASNMTKLLIKSAIVPPVECARPNNVAARARVAAMIRRNRDPQGFSHALGAVLVSWENSGALTDTALVRAVGAFGATSEFWHLLPPTALERARSYLPRADTATLVDGRLFGHGRPLDAELAAVFDDVLDDLTEDELFEVLKQTPERAHFVPRLLELIGESDSFETAARRMAMLARVGPHLDERSVAVLQERIVANPSDQIRPARDVEEALIAAFRAGQPTKPEVLLSWQELARVLVETTDSKRYFGNERAVPYGRLKDVVDGLESHV